MFIYSRFASCALAAAMAVATAQWSYEGATGPSHWGDLDPAYAACSKGAHQSPVNLPARVPSASRTFGLTLGTATGEVVDTGHTAQLNAPGDALVVRYGGRAYRLVQLHVHTPAEHTVGGRLGAAEFHFVLDDNAGHLLALGVIVVKGARSAAWQPFV